MGHWRRFYRNYSSIVFSRAWDDLGIDINQVASEFRAGGYALNGWVVRSNRSYGYEREVHFVRPPDWHLHHHFFGESSILLPSRTPFLADAIYPIVYPREIDAPPLYIKGGNKDSWRNIWHGTDRVSESWKRLQKRFQRRPNRIARCG
jgi:hypothetical protein